MNETTIVIAIGNSDDKLTQVEWSNYWSEVNEAITAFEALRGARVYGRWQSPTASPYQNAAWSLGLDNVAFLASRDLKNALREIAGRFRQDSIAWTFGHTELLPPRPVVEFELHPGGRA